MSANLALIQYMDTGSEYIRCPCEHGRDDAYGNLHQETVEIYPEESSPMVLSIPATGGRLIAEAIPARKPNPSARTQGIRIIFSCERCDRRPELCISQHKGNTEIGWDTDTF